MPTSTPSSSKAGPSTRSCLVLAAIVLGAVAVIASVGIAVYLLVKPPGENNPGTSLPVEKATPTPPFVSPVSPPVNCEIKVSSGDTQVAVPLPLSLSIGEAEFPVSIDAPEQDADWSPSGSPGKANWLCGTVVNYCMGLEPTDDNEALLGGLKPGDEIKVNLSNGVALVFRYAEQHPAAAHEAGVLDQFQPRLSLIMESGTDQWLVATADYASEIEPLQPPSAGGPVVPLGQEAQAGAAKVTVIQGHAKTDSPGLPPGTMYYLVEYAVTNSGTAPLDTAAFATQLQDGVDNVFLPSPAAGASGENGPLTGEIAPGATAKGTAGYLVPQALAGPQLTWVFSPQPGSNIQASVKLPYEATPGTATTAILADVDITDAFLDDDVLILEGRVRNLSNDLLSLEQSDIVLTSNAGMSVLRLAAPPLPWDIPAGKTQVIELQYEKPNASSVLLTMLGYSFEIRGLDE